MSELSRATPWYLERLACPDCQAELESRGETGRCSSCAYTCELSSYPVDLRPRNPRPYSATFSRSFRADPALEPLDFRRPPLTFDGPKAVRDSRELFSAIQQHRPGPGNLLDLGCGPRDQASPAEFCGFRYVGIDLFSEAADVKADAHAIPFRDESFDVVLSYAVLEHLHNPFVALAEVRRVLRPGGIFVGTVSQGEPFHHSFLHHTPWGLASVASSAGLRIERLWPSRDTLLALAEMGHYSRPVRWGLRLLAAIESRLPFLTPRRWLRWSQREKDWDSCVRSGSIAFLLMRES